MVSFMKKVREQEEKSDDTEVLFLNGGGTVAGGPFDRHERLPSLNTLRSGVILRALKRASLDALCLGDEEFGLGVAKLRGFFEKHSLSFLSSNVILPKEAGDFYRPYRIFELFGASTRVAVIALTTKELKINEFGLAMPKGTTVEDPIERALSLAEELADSVDLVIYLSHIGESKNRELLARSPQRSLLLSAHRKCSPDVFYPWAKGWILNFDYTVGEIRELRATFDDDELADLKLYRHQLEGSVTEDAATKQEVTAAEELTSRMTTIEIYALADCPHCAKVERSLKKLEKELAGKVLLRRFLLPPSGKEELLPQERSNRWRALRLGVSKSPEIFIDKRAYRGSLKELSQVVKESLEAKGRKTDERSHLPAIEAALLTDERQVRKRREEVTGIIDSLFPKCRTIELSQEDDRAEKFLSNLEKPAFPQVFISGELEKLPGFQELLLPHGDGYRLSDSALKRSFFPHRKKRPRQLTILGQSPMMLQFLSSIAPLLAETSQNTTLDLAPLAQFKGLQQALEHLFETLGAERTINVRVLKPEKARQYIHGFSTPIPLPCMILENREVLTPLNERDAAFLLRRAKILPPRVKLEE